MTKTTRTRTMSLTVGVAPYGRTSVVRGRRQSASRHARTRSVAAEYLAEPGPSGLFTRLTGVGLLLQSFQEGCLGRFGLRFIDFSVLRVLELAGSPYRMSPTRLSEIVLRPTGGMTQILDRLEQDRLVKRSPDPSDRRKVIVGLTEHGLEVAERASARYAEARRRLLANINAAEVKQIDAAVRRLLEVFEGERYARVQPGYT